MQAPKDCPVCKGAGSYALDGQEYTCRFHGRESVPWMWVHLDEGRWGLQINGNFVAHVWLFTSAEGWLYTVGVRVAAGCAPSLEKAKVAAIELWLWMMGRTDREAAK